MYGNGTLYGSRSGGFGFSPDRSRDIDRFNPSTGGNYPTSYNSRGCGCYVPNGCGSTESRGIRGYDGAGRPIRD